MSDTARKGLAIGGGVLALAIGAFFLLGNKAASDLPIIGGVLPEATPTCPLTGVQIENEKRVERPAVAVKIENSPAAYPLSGLEEADLVYEELVEGGQTRFMSIFHCGDSDQAGPVRSARLVDPAIMTPITRILAFSGANAPVLAALEESEIVMLEENTAEGGLFRVEREGISSEHTLYGDTATLRKLGRDSFDDSPPDDLFAFGELDGESRKASTISINFTASNTISYEWSGEGWLRSEADAPFVSDTGEQIEVENVLIEEHTVTLSREIVDSAGNPSVEIEDVTGSGRAVLFRDGRAVRGRWIRESVEDPVSFETRAGDEMVLAPGSVWIELVPSDAGEVQGSFDYAK